MKKDTMEEDVSNIKKQCYSIIGIMGDSSCEKLQKFLHCRNCPEYSKAGKILFDRDIPEGYLDEWTKLFAGKKETEIPGTEAIIVFAIQEEWLAFKIFFLQEVTEIYPVHSVPFRTGNVFKGLVNIHGELLPCVSVSNVIGLPEEKKRKKEQLSGKRMIVVNRNGERFVFTVDKIYGVYRISPEKDIKSPAEMSDTSSSLMRGVFSLNDKMIGLFDEDKFFNFLNGSLVY